MKTRNLHFETLQLHAGQELPDPTTVPVPFLSIKLLRMYSATPNMRQTVLPCAMQAISTDG